ncbi:MAG: hypothetical protein ACOH5I_02205 [Oligoflexus sp.]
MDQKRKKALKVAGFTGFIVALPLFYLAYLYATNLKVDVTGMGIVPEFAYTFVNDPVGITQYDTEQYPMVVAILKDSCDVKNEGDAFSSACQRMLEQMRNFEEWSAKHIEIGQRFVANPRKLRLIAMLEGQLPPISDRWSVAQLEEGMPYLVPENRRDAEVPAFVLIDDSSFFRGYILSSHERAEEKLMRELSRIVSHQYLMHYVTQQTLMWEKAKGREIASEKTH